MNFFDTHGHLNLAPLAEKWQQHWQEANQNGVTHTFVPGTSLPSSELSLELAGQQPNILGGLGIHPSEAAQLNLEETISKLNDLAAKHSVKLAGIGETGLDYFWLKENEEKKIIIAKQKELFQAHLKLALKYQLPISIHVRDKNTPITPESDNAYWDTLAMMKDYASQLTWILHCASGPESYIQEAVRQGALISFAGNITYPKAENIRKLLAITPKDRVLTETDAPYLPPQEFRGKICEPWMVTKTAAAIAEIKQTSLEQLYDNALRTFNLL